MNNSVLYAILLIVFAACVIFYLTRKNPSAPPEDETPIPPNPGKAWKDGGENQPPTNYKDNK